MKSDAPAGILARLKFATRAEHDAIESALDLMTPSLSHAHYCWHLQRLYGFYRPMERILNPAAPWADWGIAINDREKSALLAHDLHILGMPAPATLPECADLPSVTSAAAAFGCLYVLEGATLGGRVISRHLERTLGLDAGCGAHFFNCYGAESGARWRSFRAALTAFSASAPGENETVAAAIDTFRALRVWCASPIQSQPRLGPGCPHASAGGALQRD